MSKSLIDLISILDLEPLEVNLFRGSSPKTSWQRVFGGQVIGQAMVAACRTVEGRLPHSLHCYGVVYLALSNIPRPSTFPSIRCVRSCMRICSETGNADADQ